MSNKTNMKFGILCNFYGFPEYLDSVLQSWKDLDKSKFIFSAVSCKYDQYKEVGYIKEDKDTISILNSKYKDLFLKITSGEISNDSVSRNFALKPLIESDANYIWLLDGDEFYTVNEISKIVNFVEQNQFVDWFKINFKNYFNDTSHWVDGFNPPRIFKVKSSTNMRFYYENDILYETGSRSIDYKSLSSLEIPKSVSHVKHFSWCGDKEFLKKKVEYQNYRYNGICSYKWSDTENKLILNDDFYYKHNLSKPIIHND